MGGASSKLTGRRGEQLAAEFLRKKGWRVVGMNFSCRFGEVDLIAENRDYLVFAEVKTRKNARFAQAREFVTPTKQRRVLLAAQLWLQRNPTKKQPRFDVIEVYGAEGEHPELIHIENAFEL
ncbi:MAG: YraN family protein [Oscillospiraceae bacterium]|nr:YraN family protein [Oscillospiraceae bacterium]